MRPLLRPCLRALLACSLAHADRAAHAQELDPTELAPDPARLERVVLATALDRPLELDVASDGRVFFIELAGRLAVFDPERGRVIDVARIRVFADQENGLLGLARDPTRPVVSVGLSGRLDPPAASEGPASGCWVIDATYTDLGSGAARVLSASARAILRSTRVEAEHWSKRAGTQILDSSTASGGRLVGAVDHENHLVFERVDLAGIARVVASVSSAGAGGTIHLREGASDGASLASFTVEPNGAWEEWFALESPLRPTSGTIDLWVTFENPANPSALLNLDWLEFRR